MAISISICIYINGKCPRQLSSVSVFAEIECLLSDSASVHVGGSSFG